jgi:HK97 family phage major capsid protein
MTSTSGAGVPTDMERRIINKLQQANVLRSMCPVRTIDSKRTITVEGDLPVTSKIAEGGTINAEAGMNFGTAISVSFTKYVTRVKVSNEMLEDGIGNSGIGSFADYVAEKAGLSLGLYTEQQYTLGDGSGDPQGIAANGGPITQVTDLAGAAVTTVTGDNLIDTAHLVSPQYRSGPRFSWLISDTFLKTVRKLKVNSTDYVWKPSDNGGLAEGVPGSIYGIPYRVGKYVDTATVNGNVFAVVGNFDYFEIFDRSGMTSMVDPYSQASSGYTNLYFYLRTDSRCTLAEAFAAITC